METYIQLLEDLCEFHNRALALGVNLAGFTDGASRLINEKMDKDFAAEIAEIKNAIRRPSSGSIQ